MVAHAMRISVWATCMSVFFFLFAAVLYGVLPGIGDPMTLRQLEILPTIYTEVWMPNSAVTAVGIIAFLGVSFLVAAAPCYWLLLRRLGATLSDMFSSVMTTR